MQMQTRKREKIKQTNHPTGRWGVESQRRVLCKVNKRKIDVRYAQKNTSTEVHEHWDFWLFCCHTLPRKKILANTETKLHRCDCDRYRVVGELTSFPPSLMLSSTCLYPLSVSIRHTDLTFRTLRLALVPSRFLSSGGEECKAAVWLVLPISRILYL